VFGAGAGAAYKLGRFKSSHTVPALTGLTLAQAGTLLQGDSYTLNATGHVHSSTVAAGTIVSQNPQSGASAATGTTITVVISDGPVLVTLPTSLVGEDCATATSQLAAVKVNAACPTTAQISSATVPAGRVAEVVYNGSRNPLSVPQNANVTLALSTGPATGPTGTTGAAGSTTTTTTTKPAGTIAMPKFVGLTRAQVNALAYKDQIYYDTRGPLAGTTRWTTVTAQSIAPGTAVKPLSHVYLTVR
jgi:beta-lactam-binding protein with PASTA domain